MTAAAALDGASRPALKAHVRLRHDPARDGWVLLGPERVLMLDGTATAILQLCDGTRSVSQIAEELAARYAAATEPVMADVIEMLQNLRDKGLVC
ncbi:MAG: pyrroloquinoline quinone biosynthesis peptide chaperone PqqD [Acetobacteraceae bacterium]